MGFDKVVHKADGYTPYQNFSLWDTYRPQNQLLEMIQPAVARDTALSAYLARPDQRSYDLADLTLRYLKRELKAEEPADQGQLSFDSIEEDRDGDWRPSLTQLMQVAETGVELFYAAIGHIDATAQVVALLAIMSAALIIEDLPQVLRSRSTNLHTFGR